MAETLPRAGLSDDAERLGRRVQLHDQVELTRRVVTLPLLVA